MPRSVPGFSDSTSWPDGRYHLSTHTMGFKETLHEAGSARNNPSLLRLRAYLWERGVCGRVLAFPSLPCP